MNCWNSIKGYSGPSCTVCSTPLTSEYSRVCRDCLLHRPHFSSVLSFGIYSGALREAIHLLKFSGIKRLAKPLGRLLHDIPVPQVDCIVPVPLSKKTLRQRGFNQTLLIARVLSERLGIPVSMDVLYKNKDTLPQIGLGAKERSSNLRKAFEVVGNVTDKRVILLDDVMTTGATARECSKTLIRAGAKEVVVVTLARSSMD
jgi:ComF family protein